MASEYTEKKSALQRIFSYQVFAPLILAGVFVAMDFIPIFHQLENLTLDQRIIQRSYSQEAPDPRILYIGIDDTDLNHLGGWPIKRENYARFIAYLENSKPSVLVFDLLLDTPREGDELFVQVASETATPLVMGASSAPNVASYALPDDFSNAWPADDSIKKSAKNHLTHMILPIPGMRPYSKFSIVDVPKDSYGVVRKLPMYLVAKDQLIPTMALQAVMSYWKLNPENVRIIPGDAIYLESAIIKRRIPIDPYGNYLVNFRYDIVSENSPFHNQATFNNYTLFGLLIGYQAKNNGETPQSGLPDVRDKIVLLGTSATGATDVGPSPFQAESPRPLIHVNMIDNILKEDYLREISKPWIWLTFFLVAYTTAFALTRSNFWVSSIVPLVIIGLYIAAAFYVFTSLNIIIPIVAPSLAFFLLHVGSVGKQVLEERAARDHLRRTFSTYVSSGILDAIYKNPDSLQLGGGYKDVTILFSDIRSFTTMTESMDSVALVQQLNEYFTEMVGCINKYNGTLHKFIGDAIMAVWGDVAYAGSTVDAGQALRAAIDMREALKVLNARWVREGRPEFHMGIGINHGKVVVGNIGAPQRMEFTVIGDSVNLASRLEGLTKKFGIEIMVGESVYDLTHERFAFRNLAKVQVVGKTQPTKIFEPLYELGQESLSPYNTEWVRLFEEAYARFSERRYDVAIRLFEACLNEHPDNTTTLMLLEMSRNFSENPPPEDWNGAFEFTSK